MTATVEARVMSCAREMKFHALELKRLDQDGFFEGYASLFNREDLGQDVILRGAFRESLAKRGAHGVKLLFQHDPNQVIGLWLAIEEDARGLYARGRLLTEIPKAREVLALMRAGALDGLSIGFKAVRARRDARTGVRRLESVDLWEISVVTFPMLPDARVVAVKGDAASRIRTAARLINHNVRRGSPTPNPSPQGGWESGPACGAGIPLPLAGRGWGWGKSQTSNKAIPGVTSHMLEIDGLETKANRDIGRAFDDFMTAFEAFKETNDLRLGEIETRQLADVLTSEKLDRIDRALDDQKRVMDDLAVKAQRPPLGGAAPRSATAREHKAAFEGYVRKGEARHLRDLEAKALSVGSDPDGGYLVPDETETTINRALRDLSPIRAIAGVRQVSSTVYKRPFTIAGPATGWVAETAARTQTNTPTLAELAFPTMELYAMPAATSTLLDDSAVNVDEWLAEEVRIAFAEQEDLAFVSGDGVNKPKGFLAYPTVANATWTWGNIGFIATGAAGAFPASNPTDKLIDLAYAVKSAYRANASYVMNRATQSAIRKFKDADGNYIWQPGAKAGEAPSLLGHPVAESENMPDIAANSLSVAFGDFRRGYLVVDRVGIRVLRDPFSAKPYVLFYTTKRVGGGVSDFDAIKVLKFAV